MTWQVAVTLVAVLAAALDAGAFFAFSNFVMPALRRLDPAVGAAAMRAINEDAPNPLFVAAIVGAGPITVPVLAVEWSQRTDGWWQWLAVGAVASVASFVVTVAANVPRNDRLAASTGDDVGSVWSDYLRSWTRWNTVRTVASAVSVVAMAQSLRGR